MASVARVIDWKCDGCHENKGEKHEGTAEKTVGLAAVLKAFAKRLAGQFVNCPYM